MHLIVTVNTSRRRYWDIAIDSFLLLLTSEWKQCPTIAVLTHDSSSGLFAETCYTFWVSVSMLHFQDPGQTCPLKAVHWICIIYSQMYIYEIIYLEKVRS